VVVSTAGATTTPSSVLFQFNPGALPGTQTATASISDFTGLGSTAGPTVGSFQLDNSKVLNELTLPITQGTGFSFDLTIAGDAVTNPRSGQFGSSFAVQLLAADGKTALLSADPSGAVFIADLNPDGTATARSLALGSSGGVPPALAQNVADAALSGAGRSLQPALHQDFTGVVASFMDTSPFGPAADFKASISWGDGHSSAGRVISDGNGGFLVQGTNNYSSPGTFPVQVTITDIGGSSTEVSGTALVASLPAAGSGDGPRLLAVRRYGFHMHPTVLDLVFNEPLDPASVRDPRDYRIIAPERVTGSNRRVEQVVRVNSVTYDPGSLTVTLYPRRLLDFHYPFRLTVRGAAPHGVRDVLGRLFDGAGSGRPGSNETTIVTRRNLVVDLSSHNAHQVPATRARHSEVSRAFSRRRWLPFFGLDSDHHHIRLRIDHTKTYPGSSPWVRQSIDGRRQDPSDSQERGRLLR
jgi:hypothetical protein